MQKSVNSSKGTFRVIDFRAYLIIRKGKGQKYEMKVVFQSFTKTWIALRVKSVNGGIKLNVIAKRIISTK